MSVNIVNDKYIEIDRTPFEINAPLTVSFWVNMTSIVDGKGIYTQGVNSGILCIQQAANKVKMYVREKTPIQWQDCESTAGLNTNQWYHFCQVITANDMHFYIDTVDQEAINPGGYGGDINYAAEPLHEYLIGVYNAGEFTGYIEDFAQWNVELNAAEIFLLAKSFKKRMPLQIQPANLMLYLPFDDKNIGVAYGASEARDLSGNNRHGSSVGGPTGAEGILSYPSRTKHI